MDRGVDRSVAPNDTDNAICQQIKTSIGYRKN